MDSVNTSRHIEPERLNEWELHVLHTAVGCAGVKLAFRAALLRELGAEPVQTHIGSGPDFVDYWRVPAEQPAPQDEPAEPAASE